MVNSEGTRVNARRAVGGLGLHCLPFVPLLPLGLILSSGGAYRHIRYIIMGGGAEEVLLYFHAQSVRS